MTYSEPARGSLLRRLKGLLPLPVKHALRTLWLTPDFVRTYGLVGGLVMLVRLLQPRGGLVVVTVPDIMHPINLRAGTSDIAAFGQVLLRHSYAVPLGGDFATIVDGGANIGCAAIYFANRFPAARIVAVEPDPANFELLQMNVAAYPNVTPLWGALWPTHAELAIANPAEESWKFQVQEAAAGAGKLAAITMDDLLANAPDHTIDILKLDIEGAEKSLLEHSATWIPSIGVIMIELHDRLAPGCSDAFYTAAADFTVIGQWGENLVACNRRYPVFIG